MRTKQKMQNLTSNGFFVVAASFPPTEMKDNHWFLMKKNIYDCLCRTECLLVFNTLYLYLKEIKK